MRAGNGKQGIKLEWPRKEKMPPECVTKEYYPIKNHNIQPTSIVAAVIAPINVNIRLH